MEQIELKYRALGGPDGVLGPGVGGLRRTPDGRAWLQVYRHGTIAWSPDYGAAAVYGAIADAWRRTGGDHGPLGCPIGDVGPRSSGAGWEVRCEFGTLRYTPAVARLSYFAQNAGLLTVSYKGADRRARARHPDLVPAEPAV